jgi:hypothetical protein
LSLSFDKKGLPQSTPFLTIAKEMGMSSRVKIELTFEADLDMVPGWGYEPEDWVNYVTQNLMTNRHYNPCVTVHKVVKEGK